MATHVQDVVTYLAQVPPDRRDALNRLRDLCRAVLVGYEECIAYKMPCYRRGGVVEIAFANQKGYISFYVLKHEVMTRNAQSLTGLNTGKGCIRFRRPEQIDFEVVEHLLRETLNSPEQPC